MSGICGVVRDPSAPALDRAALDAMTARMKFRGPDGQRRWSDATAGLGHALLRTTNDTRGGAIPLTLDGVVHITADARIDARENLTAALRAAGCPCAADSDDAELILHAYRVWGESCVDRLLGDFSFAIWDARTGTLFCARDHFGVKPFFHARAGEAFVFSNTLDALIGYPGVHRGLDDLSIADFLLFDRIQDPSATAYAAVRRLPPAHALTVRQGNVRTRRYWSVPDEEVVRYRKDSSYVEAFNDALDRAVRDRLRTDRVSVSMSGGLDSPAVAAAALRVARRDGRPLGVQAHTLVYDELIPDSERHFSKIAADALGIPILQLAGDDEPLYPTGTWQLAEPWNEPANAAAHGLMVQQAAHSRVVLTGWDGDMLLNESPKPYFRWLLRKGRWARLAAGVGGYAVSERRLLPRRGLSEAQQAQDSYPAWLDREFEARLSLPDRWRAVNAKPAATHAIRPYAHRVLSWLGQWSNFFDFYDAGATRLPLEARHPFLDLRVVELCLTLPPYPWCIRKEILRRSLTGVLPDEVRMRPKTALGGSPAMALLSRADTRWNRFVATPGLERYVDPKRVPRVWHAERAQAAWIDLRPVSLGSWLRTHAFDAMTGEPA